MASGIDVDSDLKELFNQMKQNKLASPLALLVMQISPDKTKIIKTEELCKETCSVEELAEFYADKDRKSSCHYSVYDWDKQKKLILIKWAPDTAGVKDKMLYASSFDAVKRACDGVKGIIEATEPGDLEERELQSAKK